MSEKVSYQACRAAVRSALSAELGSSAIAAARSGSVYGAVRGRGPAAVMMFVAEREGRLVWQSPDGFAILEPPLADRGPLLAGGFVLSLTRILDRHWPFVIIVGPIMVALLSAVGLVLISSAFWVVSLVLVFVTLVYLVVHQGVGFWSQMRWLRTMARPNPSEWVTGSQWHIRLCHQSHPHRADELITQAKARLTDLVVARVRNATTPMGGRTEDVAVTQPLAVLLSGVSTTAMVAAIREQPDVVQPFGKQATVVLRLPDTEPPARVPSDRGTFLFFYLAALAASLFCLAPIVADWERSACAPDLCADRPASYPLAARWLAGRLLVFDVDQLSPVSSHAFVIGWLMSVAGLMTIPIAAVAARNAVRYLVHHRRAFDASLVRPATVLILTVKENEGDAVLAAVHAVNWARPARQRHGDNLVFELGNLGGTRVLLGQSGDQGTTGPNGIHSTALDLIKRCRPDFVILTGICYGLWDEQEEIGDVIVAQRVDDLDHVKVTERPEGPIVHHRGLRIATSRSLLSLFEAARKDWPTPPAVHFGVFASSNTVLDSASRRNALRQDYPELAGGDMESAGVAAAATEHKVDWIVVKGISDRGMRMHYDDQAVAARNSADFVIHAIRKGHLRARSEQGH